MTASVVQCCDAVMIVGSICSSSFPGGASELIGVMAPRVGSRKTKSTRVDPTGISRQLESLQSLEAHEYVSKMNVYPSVLLAWLPVLAFLLTLAPSGIVAWECLKKGVSLHLLSHPRKDPWLAKPNFTSVDSAEELASAVRRVLSSMRRCAVRLFWH